jgi:hypothetical protein
MVGPYGIAPLVCHALPDRNPRVMACRFINIHDESASSRNPTGFGQYDTNV